MHLPILKRAFRLLTGMAAAVHFLGDILTVVCPARVRFPPLAERRFRADERGSAEVGQLGDVFGIKGAFNAPFGKGEVA